MFVRRVFTPGVLLQFAAFTLILATIWSALVYYAYERLGWKGLTIPFLPLATIGTAVAFYVGFKNNSAYDRLWEGRRIWGSITNISRAWSAAILDQVGSRAGAPEEVQAVQRSFLYRHLAWMNLLRLQLRRKPVFSEGWYGMFPQYRIVRRHLGPLNYEAEVEKVLQEFLSPEEAAWVRGHSNGAEYCLRLQSRALMEAKNRELLDGFEHSDAGRLLLELYHQQGAAERIKSFPFPRQYGAFSSIFIFLFNALLPFALIGEFDRLGNGTTWLAIPFTVLVSWVFNVMDQIGDASENPFDNAANDVPMTAICRNIEISFREHLKEESIPARIEPVHGVLM